MSPKWYKYKTYESWAALLQELLQQAQQAVAGENADAKSDAMKVLEEYIDNSPLAIPQTKELDDIAEAAMTKIWESTADQTLALLRKDLSKIQRIIRLAKQDAEKGDLSRKYELMADVVNATSAAIADASELVQSLGEDNEAASDLTRLITTIQKLRDKVELMS